jgi:formylglycine-generating enzyme required for sulfatase activity
MNRLSILLVACFVLAFSSCSSKPDPKGEAKQEGNATKATEKPTNPKAGNTITNSIGMKLAYIPAGEFTMGSPENEENRKADEGPQHKVKITKAYYMGVYELKQREYEKVMGKHLWAFSDPDNPAENVNWDDAVKFCKQLSEIAEEKQAGRAYRLPTEAEWEYACRAGTTTAFHFGNSLTAKQANFGGKKTVKCGSYPANAWGLHDMHGNVWEWCLDGPRKYTPDAVEDPRGPEEAGGARVLRGGSYDWVPSYQCRSALRVPDMPTQRINFIGFRVLLVW